MNLRLKKWLIGTSLFTVSGVVVATGCPPVNDSVWQAAMDAAEQTIIAALDGAKEQITSNRARNLQRIQSALRVLTKQTNVTGEKQSATDVASKQAAAAVATEAYTRKAIFETAMEYNPATGQGFDPCGELARSKKIAQAVGEANTSMQEKVIREIDAGPGRFTKDRASVVGKRITDAKGLYCTADLVKAGFCSAEGSQAGKDVDATNFFEAAATDSAANQSKNALLNNLYGVPYAAPSKDVANTPVGEAYLNAKRTEDTYRSVSQASMKAIQSWNEKGEVSDSVLESIANKVNTYSGGNNYAEWEKSKVSQSEHGLMVDYAKMKALELYIRSLEYQQSERMEANIAAMLAMKARSQQSASDRQVIADAARKKVN